MNRRHHLTWAAAIAVLATSQLQAATIFWQGTGVSGALTSANYSDGTNTNLLPTASDVVNFGGGGTGTHNSGTATFQRLRIGHNQAPGGTGTGIVTVENGAAVNLTLGGGAANASMWVGNAQNGTLNIDGPGSSVTAAQMIVVGYGNNVNRSGIINITNGGSLTVTLGNILLGETTGGTNLGVQGHIFVNGNVTTGAATADLNIGATTATSSFTQSGGTVQIGDVIDVGPVGSSSDGSSFSISGGTTTHGGNFFVGRGASTNATANISGGILNTGNRFLMGGGTATGNTTNHTAGTLNTTLDVRVADAFTSVASIATYNLSGTGIINSTTGGIIGRQGIGRFFQTGGDANFNGALSIGNRESVALATNGLYEISDGDLTVATALNVAPKGTGELRVIGDDADIVVNGSFSLGNTVDGMGTLAYELENGESLSEINVAGAATFATGATLFMDASNAAPGQFRYNLLTATSIVNNGINFSAPAGWYYRIIDGGNGKILQAVVPEPASLALVLLGVAFVGVRRRAN